MKPKLGECHLKHLLFLKSSNRNRNRHKSWRVYLQILLNIEINACGRERNLTKSEEEILQIRTIQTEPLTWIYY